MKKAAEGRRSQCRLLLYGAGAAAVIVVMLSLISKRESQVPELKWLLKVIIQLSVSLLSLHGCLRCMGLSQGKAVERL